MAVDSVARGLAQTALARANQQSITRAQIATSRNLPVTFQVYGFTTPGDLGTGAIYTSQGATSGGIMAIQSLDGIWYNLVISDTIVELGWFGVVADGVSDNATGLMQANAAMIGNQDLWSIHAPGNGVILSSSNRWLAGINRYDLYGHGSTFSIIYTGAIGALAQPFLVGNMFQTNVPTFTGSYTWTSLSALFNTATIGSYSITLTTTANISNFAVGNRILLWGYEQIQGGFPPGARYFEWNKISGINSGAGIITLERSLRNNYSTTWWDMPNVVGTGNGSGLPRVTNIDNPSVLYATYAGFHDLTFGQATGGVQGDIYIPAQHLYMERVSGQPGGRHWPSENETAKYVDCVFHLSEFDKMVDVLTCIRCKWTGTGNGVIGNQLGPNNGTGINKVVLIDCDVDQSLQICPRYYEIHGGVYKQGSNIGTFSQCVQNCTAGITVRSVVLDRLQLGICQSNAASSLLSPDLFNSYTLSSANIDTATPSNDIIIPWVSWGSDASNLPAKQIEAGVTRMFTSTGSKYGLVTTVEWDQTINSGGGGYRIQGDWNVQPASSEVWLWSQVAELIDMGGHVAWSIPQTLWGASSARWSENKSGRGKIHTMQLTNQSIVWSRSNFLNVLLYGKMIDIEINVGKPYNGTASTAFLVLKDQSATVFMTVDLKTSGRRYLSEFQAFGNVGSDSFSANSIIGTWKQSIEFVPQSAGNTNISDLSLPALPEFYILIRWKES